MSSAGEQARGAIRRHERVEERDVGATAGQELCAGDGSEDGSRAWRGLLGSDGPRGSQRLGEPRDVHVSEGLYLRLHELRQVVVLRGHEAAEAESVSVLERDTKDLGVASEAAQWVGRVDRHL